MIIAVLKQEKGKVWILRATIDSDIFDSLVRWIQLGDQGDAYLVNREGMNCLCCGKTLNNGGIDGWHKKCIKKFFGTNEIPEIDINKSIIEKIALEVYNKRIYSYWRSEKIIVTFVL